MPFAWQFLVVGLLVGCAVLGALASLSPARWRLALAEGLDGRLPAALVARLRPRGGCGACGGGSPSRARP